MTTDRRLYALVTELALSLGARAVNLVPFAAYAKAALGLTRSSSLARALVGGATRVERIDLLVMRLLAAQGLDPALLEAIVAAIEARLAENAAGIASAAYRLPNLTVRLNATRK